MNIGASERILLFLYYEMLIKDNSHFGLVVSLVKIRKMFPSTKEFFVAFSYFSTS